MAVLTIHQYHKVIKARVEPETVGSDRKDNICQNLKTVILLLKNHFCNLALLVRFQFLSCL